MIRKNDKLHTHLEGSFTVIEAPRVWTLDKQFLLRSDDTGEIRTLCVPELFNALQSNYYQHEAIQKMTVKNGVLWVSVAVLLVINTVLVISNNDKPELSEQPAEVVEVMQETPKNSACGIAVPWEKISTPVDGYRCFAYTHQIHRQGHMPGTLREVAGIACFPEEEVDTAFQEACK